MAHVSLPDGEIVLISEADKDLIQYRWYRHTGGYAHGRFPPGKISLLHRVVMARKLRLRQLPAGMEVDHVNRDKMDNRRENLELVTREENMRRAFSSPARRCRRRTLAPSIKPCIVRLTAQAANQLKAVRLEEETLSDTNERLCWFWQMSAEGQGG